MPFTAIKGTYHVTGYAPDGDSIRFMAQNPASWEQLEGKEVALNAKGHAQLRIEAIDTLETHYKSKHQPLKYADLATRRLHALLGIKDVTWSPSHARVISAKDGIPGTIITRMAEENGRPVSYLYDQSLDMMDGEPVYLEKLLARKSVNFRMLREGLAFPTFYDGLFYDLRELFARETEKARKARRGVWAEDRSNKLMQISSLEDITDEIVLLPKLFRRMVVFFQNRSLFNPLEFLRVIDEKNERVLILNQLHFTHLEDILEINAQGQMKLTEKPEELVFLA